MLANIFLRNCNDKLISCKLIGYFSKVNVTSYCLFAKILIPTSSFLSCEIVDISFILTTWKELFIYLLDIYES